MAETQIEKLMRILECSKEEAESIIATDKAIDKGEKTDFDLTAEQQATAKKYTKVGTRKTSETKTPKTHKENPTKATVIAEVAKFLEENGYEMVEITNKERQIAFSVKEHKYELTLVQKRMPKN